MAQDNMATNVINGVLTGSAGPTPPTPAAAQTVPSSRPTAGAGPGRGVLDGAFAVLEALAGTADGLGLTALARTSGLAKASAYRLAEQLVELGAVHRQDYRYFIGPRIGRLGQCWQPDPLLRQAAQAPVHHLAVQSGATAALRILHEDTLRLICATARHGQACLPMPADPQSTARTATGRVLFAAQPAGSAALPDCWTAHQWQELRDGIRDPYSTVVDHEDAFPGICCVAAPVWSPSRTCAGAVTVLVQAPTPAANLPDLVVHAARRIGDRLR
jgi:DNA-binding IclR family transcriptional regulator